MTFRTAAESSANNNFLPVSNWIPSLAARSFLVRYRLVLVQRVPALIERSTRAKTESRVFLEQTYRLPALDACFSCFQTNAHRIEVKLA